MGIAEIIGYFAAAVGSLIFIPQAIQTVKTKNTKALSLPSFILISLNNFLWMLYGLLTMDVAIILSQVFVLPLGLLILVYKFRYG
ncbi:MAG: SemiSWEET family transporter [Melioribacteraceae bacterium]|jgi:MtN3 and saliva related transmembrane protein